MDVRSGNSNNSGTDPTTIPVIPYAFPRNTLTLVASNTSPYPTIDPMVVFTSTLEEFYIAFPFFVTATYYLEDPLKFLLTANSTRLQKVIELLQAPNSPTAHSTATKYLTSDFNTEDPPVSPKPHHFQTPKYTLYSNSDSCPASIAGGPCTTTSYSDLCFTYNLNKTHTPTFIVPFT